MADLFDFNLKKSLATDAPLAERVRPTALDDFFGQADLIGQGKLLRQLIEQDELPSMIFWGPPGTGKSTLARIIATKTKSVFVQLSAVAAGVKELRQIIDAAEERRKMHGQKTVLFIDEIHRWNRTQQDGLLPYVERGVVTLIGATTENPSFVLVSALLSRSRVFIFQALAVTEIETILVRALRVAYAGRKITFAPDCGLAVIAQLAHGDARAALNILEMTLRIVTDGTPITRVLVMEASQKSVMLYDAAGDQHYTIISALHKSIRGGDADAALYWLGRMLEGGEDPLYIARRLIRVAVEDVGLADPQALVQAVACQQACHAIGMPECDIILGQCVVYLARAPKSVEVYRAYGVVKQDVAATAHEPVPLHLRNAPTAFLKELGYGAEYQYSPDHDWKEKQTYLPNSLIGRTYLDKRKK